MEHMTNAVMLTPYNPRHIGVLWTEPHTKQKMLWKTGLDQLHIYIYIYIETQLSHLTAHQTQTEQRLVICAHRS